jgi:hypothetical protein
MFFLLFVFVVCCWTSFRPIYDRFLSMAENDFHIYIIEQSSDGRKFNRGKLLNIGFVQAQRDDCKIFIFHDVDLIPSDNLLTSYTADPGPTGPVHIARLWDRYSKNPDYFGGIVSFSESQFRQINGFPNNYWGWGGEDDEMKRRVDTVSEESEREIHTQREKERERYRERYREREAVIILCSHG